MFTTFTQSLISHNPRLRYMYCSKSLKKRSCQSTTQAIYPHPTSHPGNNTPPHPTTRQFDEHNGTVTDMIHQVVWEPLSECKSKIAPAWLLCSQCSSVCEDCDLDDNPNQRIPFIVCSLRCNCGCYLWQTIVALIIIFQCICLPYEISSSRSLPRETACIKSVPVSAIGLCRFQIWDTGRW